MNRDQAVARFFEVVKEGKRRNFYDRTVDKSDTYLKLTTGEGLDELLEQFALRESNEMFEQRKRMTKHIIKSVVKNLLDVFFKVPRSNYIRTLGFQGDDGNKKKKEFEKILSEFWGDQSLDDYLATRFIELNSVDPNSFVVIEWNPFDNEKERAKPYPFEVSAKEAVDYTYTNHILDYLIVKQNLPKENTGSAGESLSKYTLYHTDQTFQLIEIDTRKDPVSARDEEITQIDDGRLVIRLGRLVFEYIEHTPHNLGQVPAFQVGYVRDLYTKGSTYLNLYDAAIPFLEKSIKVNSELDLVMSLIAFPLRIRYVDACKNPECFKGLLRESGETCPVCNGTDKAPTSAQEEITIKLPDNAEDIQDLDKFLTYKAPPVDIISFQDEYIEKLSRNAKKIVFNSDIYDKKQIAETATGKNIDLQNVYDTLYPLALKFARSWEFCVEIIAKITDFDTSLVHSLRFSKDFKLKSLEDLLSELERINKSGGGTEIRKNVNKDILRLMYSDDQVSFVRWEVQESFNPFAGKTEEEIMFQMSSDFVPKRTKVLYANLGQIFDQLEAESEINIYELPKQKLRDLVSKKVDELMTEIKENTPTIIPELN